YLQKQGLRGAVPLPKTETRAAHNSDSEGGLRMAHLYRSTTHLQHWFAYIPATGWVVFPAKENGWEDRRKSVGLDPPHLFEVPLWMAFGTGLSADAECTGLRPAA
ncbi:MAG: hypothetical protein ABSH45_06930, partial [Bryobacteraceae bacterium]